MSGESINKVGYSLNSKVKEDLMFQYLDSFNSSINLTIELYNNGVKTAEQLGKDLIKAGKDLIGYVNSYGMETSAKFKILLDLVNELNPINKNGKENIIDSEKIKELEQKAINIIEKPLEKEKNREAEIEKE